MQFGKNKHEYIFSKTLKIARAHRGVQFLVFSKVNEKKSCNYLLIIYMKKFAMVNLKGLGHAILGNFSIDRMVIELTKVSK